MSNRRPAPEYQADTNGMIVRVRPRFLHDESEPAKARFVWAYAVEIENGTEAAWTLRLRRWRIVDAMGRVVQKQIDQIAD